MSIGWLNSFVVMFFRLHNLEAKFFVEIDSSFVVHLNVPEDKYNIEALSNERRKYGTKYKKPNIKLTRILSQNCRLLIRN